MGAVRTGRIRSAEMASEIDELQAERNYLRDYAKGLEAKLTEAEARLSAAEQ